MAEGWPVCNPALRHILGFNFPFCPDWGAKIGIGTSGIILFGLAFYTALKTSWLNAAKIPLAAKITGAISIVYGWLLIGGAIIGLVLGIIMSILIIILAIVLVVAFISSLLRHHQ